MELHTVKTASLGQQHRNYNKLLNEAIKNKSTQQFTAINCEESDLDNLLKIDAACNNRNVEYVLEALKCEDMLYISRIIKKSTWLITDQQYAYIINSEYLHNNLYPHMTSKAFNKLILHIRLNLKDERRAEEFFNHYKKDLKKAFSWLPHCSVPFIENIIRKHANEVPKYLLKRLYDKSFTFLQIILKNYTASYYVDHLTTPGKFLLKRNLENFLDIIETLKSGDSFPFGPKYTRIVMERNPQRIRNNLEKYVYYLDIATFAKYLKREEVKGFIITHIKNKEMRSWLFTYKKIKHFLHRLPFEERFNFVHKLFIEKSFGDENLTSETWDDIVESCNLPVKFNLESSKPIWSWYVYAPFDKAFIDLQELIRKESNPTERLWILRTLLTCAGSDQKNILTLLKYYREYHISESFIFKVQFVNHFITKTNPSKYGEEAWRYLNDLLNSLDVSNRPKDSVETCVKFIILYNVTHGKNIPENIENKFDFEYFINYDYNDCKHKFNTDEREKIFNYFYNHYTLKITGDITTEQEFDETLKLILKVLRLLNNWSKQLKDYPFILHTIKDLIAIRKERSWRCDLSGIYNFKKSWRRLLFPESIILSPTQETCINALKHDPYLLEIYKKEINSSINKKVPFNRFLKKIRIDWYRPLSDSFKTSFTESLNQKSYHKFSIKGLCTLLPKQELLDFVQKYVPQEAKIDWSQPDDIVLSIRKNIATYMHLAKRQPPLSVVFLYAKGDYLHYVLPSLHAIFYNTSANHIRKHVKELLDTPVSLQKHVIRIAFSKLNHKELKNIFSEFWQSSKNRSTRKDIFCETYKKLCRENDETVILDTWELLSAFIDKLTFDENKKIYSTLSKIDSVPQFIRAEFQVKSYDFFKKFPDPLHFENLIKNININDMEFLDIDVMAKIFFENFDTKFTTQKYNYSRHIAIYLLSTKSESVQRERYKKILEPLIEKTVVVWNKRHENMCYARNNLRDIFDHMSTEFEDLVLNKEMAFPIAIYTDVLNKLQKILPIKENYVLLTRIKLSLGYIKILYDLKMKCNNSKEQFGSEKSEKLINLYNKAAPAFGVLCLDFLKEDVAKNCSTIYVIFAQVLKLIFDQYIKSHYYRMKVLKSFLDSKDFIEGYIVVMELMPSYYNDHIENERALRLEILRELSAHPSEQVAMHYWHLRRIDDKF